jgi:hypothetical protein
MAMKGQEVILQNLLVTFTIYGDILRKQIKVPVSHSLGKTGPDYHTCSGPCEAGVAIVGRTIDLGCWEFGMGRDWGGFKELEWGGTGEGLRKGRSVHEQPGAKVDGIAPHERRDSK